MKAFSSSTNERPGPENNSLYAAPPVPRGGKYFARTARAASMYLRSRSCFSDAHAPTTSAIKLSSGSMTVWATAASQYDHLITLSTEDGLTAPYPTLGNFYLNVSI